uniref:Serine/threonine-protein kinase 11-interacting protein n=1 Tax=Macrostomum lignano TaxID=282301 RepID=A0A1I8GRY4_9PLAT
MGSSSSSQHVKCSEEDLLIQLAKCFTNNASSLGPSSCLVLDTPVCARILRCLPRQSQLLLADAEDDEFVSVSSVSSANHAPLAGLTASAASATEHAKIVEIAISKAENLELVHNDATIEGQLDLARFHSLVRLRLKSVPMHLLLNLSERRDALRSLDVDSCAATLMSVIELCAGDRTTGAEWPRLRHLRFSGCRLRHLDLSVRYLVALTHLDLSYNQLVRVDELQHLKSLQNLNLSFNRLHRLPSLASLRNLRRIRLAYNFLESLVGLEDLRRLEVLDASNNVICHLALIGDLRRLSRLLSLDLRGNPAATAPDHRAQLLPLLNSREPKRLVLNGRRLTSVHVDADDDNNRPVEDRFADSCDISGRGEGDGCPAPGNFTIECEADVSSADEPAEQGQRQKIGSNKKKANLAVPAASSAAPLLAAADANIGDPTPVMDSIGSDVFVLPTSRMPQPEPVKSSDTAAAASASVEQELGLIRGHQFLAVQGDTGSAVMLSLAGHLLTIRHPDGRLAEEIDLRKLVALELPSASNSGLQMRLRFDQQQLVRSFQLQEDDPADAGQLASLLSPFAATVPPDRYRCARCEHSFNISEPAGRFCPSAHSLSDIREAPVCPSCGSEFIVSTDAAATTAAAKLQASSLDPPAAAVARFFVGSVGTELSAPRVSPPSLDAESVSPDPSSANAAAAEGSASADAFARTPSIVSMDTQGAAGPTLTADFNFGQSATVSESATALGTMDACEEPLNRCTNRHRGLRDRHADATTDATAGVPDDDDTKEMLADNVLMFDPTSPEVMDHRLKLHLDLSLLGDGEDAKFAVLLAGCHFLSGKRNSNWEAKRAAILVATTRQLLLLDYCPRSLAGADEDLGPLPGATPEMAAGRSAD